MKVHILELMLFMIMIQVHFFDEKNFLTFIAEDDEITLRVGDVVFIFHKHESGWWTGECNGKYGIFPGGKEEEEKYFYFY